MKRTHSNEFKIKVCGVMINDGSRCKVVPEKLGVMFSWMDETKPVETMFLWVETPIPMYS